MTEAWFPVDEKSIRDTSGFLRRPSITYDSTNRQPYFLRMPAAGPRMYVRWNDVPDELKADTTSGLGKGPLYGPFKLLKDLDGVVPRESLGFLVRLARLPFFRDWNAIRTVFDMLRRMADAADGVVPTPHVLATEHGEISLHWTIGSGDFTVDVMPSGSVEWFWEDSDKRLDAEGEADTPGHVPDEFFTRFGLAASQK